MNAGGYCHFTHACRTGSGVSSGWTGVHTGTEKDQTPTGGSSGEFSRKPLGESLTGAMPRPNALRSAGGRRKNELKGIVGAAQAVEHVGLIRCQSEETLTRACMRPNPLERSGCLREADTGGAWCRQLRALPVISGGRLRMTSKSSCPLCPGRHTCYNGRDKGARSCEGELTPKTCPQFGLQAATRLHEAGIGSNCRSAIWR
ncbi:hypothetical protein Tco_1353250 [Tanacetum coccineum]